MKTLVVLVFCSISSKFIYSPGVYSYNIVAVLISRSEILWYLIPLPGPSFYDNNLREKHCDIALCIMVWSKIIMHAILGPYCPALLSASWTPTLIWVQSVQGLPGSLALCCLSNTGSLCFMAAQWTLQGPHRHKGMFGWIRYTATHCLFPYVWLHNSDLTSKLGQGGSCST